MQQQYGRNKTGPSLMRRAAAQGLLLPIRMYFQPLRMVISRSLQSGTTGRRTPSPTLVYLFALIWVPIGIVIGLVIFGLPEALGPDLAQLPGLGLMLAGCGLAIMLGAVVAYWHRPLGKGRAGTGFRYDIAGGLGVVFALMILLGVLMLDEIAVSRGLTVGQVVESPTLDYPVMFVYGAGVGIVAAMLSGHWSRARMLVALGLPIGVAVVALFAVGPNPDVRAGNVAFAATAVGFMTHPICQPFYLLAGIGANLGAKISPDRSRLWWRLSPANWSDFSYVPLPGLSRLVNGLYRVDPMASERAISRLSSHPFYGAIGRKLASRTWTDKGWL